MWSVFVSVFKSPKYLALALLVFAFMFGIILMLPNIPLLAKVAELPQTTTFDVIKIAWGLLGSFMTNLSTAGMLYALLLPILFAINISLAVYYFSRIRGSNAVAAGSGIGLIAGIFGIGCASCSSIVAASLLSLLGFSGSLALLPFDGMEFGIIGIALIVFSTFFMIKQLQKPLVC